MSDDDTDDRRWRDAIGTRELAVFAVIVVLAVGGVYAATTTYQVSTGAVYKTNSGMEITFGETRQVESGNPFIDTNKLEVSSTVIVSKNGAPSATVDKFNASGTWTNTSSISASSSLLIINRTDAKPIGVSGTVDSANIKAGTDLTQSVSNVELQATAGGAWTLTINNTGLAQGKGVVAVNADTGKALDSASVRANGDVELDEMPSVTAADINLKLGPSELFVYKEAKPTELVKNAQLRVRIFGQDSDTVIERTVKNGKMDLTGIPKDEPLTITVDEDTSGYAYRRTIIRNVVNQQEIYLLNTTSNTDEVDVTFKLDDRTGNFPARDTQLIISKPITKDFDNDNTDETQYQAVAGDVFGGSSEFGTVLEGDQRYRLEIRNAKGDTRLLGSYTATANDVATLEVGQVGIRVPDQQDYAATLRVITSDSNGDGTKEQFVRVAYVDRANKTEQFEYKVINESASPSATVASKTVQGRLGNHVATYKVAQNETAASYRMDWNATREQPDGTDKTISGTERAGSIEGVFSGVPIDPRWLELIGYVSIVAVGGLVVIASPALGGIVATGWAALLTILGAVAIPTPALGLAGAISVFALVGRQQ